MTTWDHQQGVVELPDGRRIRGTGVRKRSGDVTPPDFAVLLLAKEPHVAWPSRWVRWRHFRLPHSTQDALDALREAHDRAARERVEIACGGGIGRTGTALALLARLSGSPPEDAVAWARSHYHRRAVETRAQRRWVERTALIAPGTTPERGISQSPGDWDVP